MCFEQALSWKCLPFWTFHLNNKIPFDALVFTRCLHMLVSLFSSISMKYLYTRLKVFSRFSFNFIPFLRQVSIIPHPHFQKRERELWYLWTASWLRMHSKLRPLLLGCCSWTTISVCYPKLKEGYRFYKKCHFTADLWDDSDNLAPDMYCYTQCFVRLGSRKGVLLNY